MDDLVKFLKARLAEDEESARKAQHAHPPVGWLITYHPEVLHARSYDPARVLAEVEAKRPLVEFWSRAFGRGSDFPGVDWDRVRSSARWTLRLLALPYADHPDYREEWRP